MDKMRDFVGGMSKGWLQVSGSRSRYFSLAHSPARVLLTWTIVTAAFILFTIAAADSIKGGASYNEADLGFTIPSVYQQIAPDPVAPAADTQYFAAPPSGQASQKSTSLNISDGQVALNVNGKKVEVPANGTVNTTVTSPDGVQSNVSATQTTTQGYQTNQSISITSTNSASSSTAFGNTTFSSTGGQ